MSKKRIKEEFVEMYLDGKELDEYSLLTNQETFYKEAVKEFGSWNKFETEIGFLQRHLKERRKFEIYWLLKKRLDRFGEESLRHKNIEEELKKEITLHFKTVKRLTEDNIINLGKESVLYEAHALVLCGRDFETIKKERPDIKDGILEFYGSEEFFLKEYNKRMFIDLNQINKIETDKSTNGEDTIDINDLVKLGYITEEEAEKIKKMNIRKTN